MTTLRHDLEKQFGVALPFFSGTLPEAQREAQRAGRYLLIYLHSPEHPQCPRFVTTVLGSSECQELLRDRMVLYGASVDTAAGFADSFALGCTTFPFVAVGVKTKIAMRLQGKISLSVFLTNVRLALEKSAATMAREIAFVADREEREQMRQLQDEQFAEAQRRDMERFEEQRRAAEAEERERAAKERERAAEERRQREEQERARRAAAEAETRAMAVEEEKAIALSILPPEPEADVDPKLLSTIRLMSLDGSPFERKYFLTDPLLVLYAAARSRPEYDGRKFFLQSGFPPKRLEEGGQPIGDVAALRARAVVHMREEL